MVGVKTCRLYVVLTCYLEIRLSHPMSERCLQFRLRILNSAKVNSEFSFSDQQWSPKSPDIRFHRCISNVGCRMSGVGCRFACLGDGDVAMLMSVRAFQPVTVTSSQ
jgi:hypothetical protein